MSAIHIRKTIDSEILRLPELRPLIGQTVDIVIHGPTAPAREAVPGTGDWGAFRRAAQALRQTYDFDALAE